MQKKYVLVDKNLLKLEKDMQKNIITINDVKVKLEKLMGMAIAHNNVIDIAKINLFIRFYEISLNKTKILTNVKINKEKIYDYRKFQSKSSYFYCGTFA